MAARALLSGHSHNSLRLSSVVAPAELAASRVESTKLPEAHEAARSDTLAV